MKWFKHLSSSTIWRLYNLLFVRYFLVILAHHNAVEKTNSVELLPFKKGGMGGGSLETLWYISDRGSLGNSEIEEEFC